MFFIWMLIFTSYHLGILMTLPTDVKWQCHHYVGQFMKVDTKVIPHTITYQIVPNYTFIFNLLGVMF